MKGIFFIFSTVALMLFSFSGYSAEKSFTPDQIKEMQGIVHKYIVDNPEILQEAHQALTVKMAKAQEEDAQKAILDNHDAIFNGDSPSVNGKNAKVTVVEFFDYNCSYCRRMTTPVKNILDENNRLRFVFKEFPVLGQDSLFASKAALAANKQGKYFEFHKLMMEASGKLDEATVLKLAQEAGLDLTRLKKDMEADDVLKEIMDNQILAQKLGLRGTPAFVVGANPSTSNMTATFIPGATSEASLQSAIDKSLANAKN